ncbi:DUF6625 family protein [Pseudomonas sp. 10B238]|uniref:DUF6625 family protein n=1 Tax=Pseudomonas sp. 10B238 TaxID=1586417 RepID=UPI000617B91B
MGGKVNTRIRLLVPYFGRWPFWMSFFLQTCRWNTDIEWLFFTDCGVPSGLPDNVKIKPMSFREYCQLVSEGLGISFKPTNPYKLCDIKPALGYLHAEHLEGFDFWGFSDIDLVYGDLKKYFSEERLAKYDLISTHARRISGHLCMLRNSKRMREAFMHVPGWQNCFEDPAHCAFDEGAFSRLFIRHKNWPEGLRRVADRFNPWRQSSEFNEAFSTPHARVPWLGGGFDFPDCWMWSVGQLTNNRDGLREFPYFHFITWKSSKWSGCQPETLMHPLDLASWPAWCVTEQGFRPSESILTTEEKANVDGLQ